MAARCRCWQDVCPGAQALALTRPLCLLLQKDLMVLNDVYRVMEVDALASSHPLTFQEDEINTPAQISEVFDSISYSKVRPTPGPSNGTGASRKLEDGYRGDGACSQSTPLDPATDHGAGAAWLRANHSRSSQRAAPGHPAASVAPAAREQPGAGSCQMLTQLEGTVLPLGARVTVGVQVPPCGGTGRPGLG